MREKERERARSVFPYDVRYTERSRGPRSACFAYTSRSAGYSSSHSIVRTSFRISSYRPFHSFSLSLSRSPLSLARPISRVTFLRARILVFIAVIVVIVCPDERKWIVSNIAVNIVINAKWISSTCREPVDDDDCKVPLLLSDPHAGSFDSIRGNETAPGTTTPPITPRALLVFAYRPTGRSSSLDRSSYTSGFAEGNGR